MRQREISDYRIMRVFNGLARATQREIMRVSGFKRAVVSRRLGELVKEKHLTFSIARDGKTKLYQPRDLTEWQRPIMLRGREKRQLPRLAELGLDVHPSLTPRGRPRTRRPAYLTDPLGLRSIKMSDDLWLLGPFTRHVKKNIEKLREEEGAPAQEDQQITRSKYLMFKEEMVKDADGEVRRVMQFSIRGFQRKQMSKIIDLAEEHQERLRGLRKRIWQEERKEEEGV